MKNLPALIMCLFFIPISTHASLGATIEVPAHYATIQEAIVAAQNGDTVLVMPGTYPETLDFLGKAITVISSDGPWTTTIEGDQTAPLVEFVNQEGIDSVLEGFTITKGRAGIYCNGASPTIVGNRIVENSPGWVGGGITCLGSSPHILRNVISGNVTQGYGGGIHCKNGSHALISDNVITNNQSQYYGGGVFSSLCSPTITNNVISNNISEYREGGGIHCMHGNPVIVNNTISGNRAEQGGGIYCGFNSAPFVANNIVANNKAEIYGRGAGIVCWQNSAEVYLVNNTIVGNEGSGVYAQGAGIYCYQSQVAIINTVLWDNWCHLGQTAFLVQSELWVTHSLMGGGKLYCYVDPDSTLYWGDAILDEDPLFADGAAEDFHLLYTSPCRDAGYGTLPGLPVIDFEGDPRVAHGTIDMGADEFYTHLYYKGEAAPSSPITAKVTGLPGAAINAIVLGLNVYDPPLPSDFGAWYVAQPAQVIVGLGMIPADGLALFPGTLPASPTGPYSVYMQAAVDLVLTNLCEVKVQ